MGSAYNIRMETGAAQYDPRYLAGIVLFNREGRGVTLTAAGQTFVAYVRDGLTMIASGAERLPGRPTDQHVAISVVPTFAPLTGAGLSRMNAGYASRHHQQAVQDAQDAADRAVREYRTKLFNEVPFIAPALGRYP